MRRLMLITLMAFPLYGNAVFESGNTLNSLCNEPESSELYYQRDADCRGYIIGVVDSLDRSDPTNKLFGYRFCLPAEVIKGQLVKVWKKWASDHPESMHFNAASLVAAAMEEAFPCK